jgi:glycosyltransferase involved in cell wall biosynthesis
LSEDARPSFADMRAPSISAVVPTVGRPELVRALRSVRAQRSPAHVELIVVYDGEPGTELPAEAVGLTDRVIYTEGRVGGARARNLGIAAATGDMVALLDDDDEWLPHKCEAQLALLQRSPDPECTVVAGRQLYVSPRGAVSRPGPDRLIVDGEACIPRPCSARANWRREYHGMSRSFDTRTGIGWFDWAARPGHIFFKHPNLWCEFISARHRRSPRAPIGARLWIGQIERFVAIGPYTQTS